MVAINPTFSVTILTVNRLNLLVKNHRLAHVWADFMDVASDVTRKQNLQETP